MTTVEFVKLSVNALTPMRGSEHSAGFDLYASEQVTIAPNHRQAIGTGIAMKIPNGYFGSIRSRSGLALKNNIDVCGGVVDSDYRGEVKVILHNSNPIDSFFIKRGDRIAQIIFQPFASFPMTSVLSLDETTRGTGGFGSTGSK